MSLRRPCGRAAFAGDIALPGALHLVLRRSPLPRARVLSLDTRQARALPGVATILTHENAASLIPAEPRFFGDRLLLVAGEELEGTRRAADLVTVELEPLAAVVEASRALEDETRVAARLSRAVGDVEAALREADSVIESTWRLPFAPALSLEPPQVVTWLDEDRRLVVRTSAESPYRVRALLAERLGLPAAGIRVVRPLVAGGSEGASGVCVEDLCAAVTLRTGRPARLALQGDEQLAAASGRPAQQLSVRIGLREGRLTGLDVRLLLDLGASRERAAEALRAAARHALGLYAAATLRIEAVAVCTDTPPAGASRGADRGAAFAVECAIDEAAQRAGLDPVAFRRSHLRRGGDPGAPLLAELGERAAGDDADALTSLLASLPAGQGAGDGALAAPAERRSASGMALARTSPDASANAGPAASLHLLDDGSFTLSTSAGASPSSDEAAYAQAAAAILSVSPSRVVCAATDTDSAAFEARESQPGMGDASLAVQEAARIVRERIREAAAQILEVPVPEVQIEDGLVIDAAGRRITFAEVGALALRAGRPLLVTAAQPPAMAPPSLAAAQAQVEVDLETGQVRISGIAVALAAPAQADSRAQASVVEGALASAVELALAGGQAFDTEGRPLLRSLRDWPLVGPSDLPPLAVSFLDCTRSRTRPSEAALGDVAAAAGLAAIAIAVARATRARLGRLPLTPPTVLDAL